MKKSRYTEEQIAFALRQAETGTPVAAEEGEAPCGCARVDRGARSSQNGRGGLGVLG